jgi:hypothetical protein
VRLKDGIVSVRVASQWSNLTTTAVSSIPNFFVFYELARRLQTQSA